MSGLQFGGSVLPGGLARVEAHYFLKATDGAVIEVTNPGVRTATPEVTEQLARGEVVDTSAYYFGTTPRFDAPPERTNGCAAAPSLHAAYAARTPWKSTATWYAVLENAAA